MARGYRVMLDADLAALYEVKTKALNQAVRRNIGRFPGDFMFQLTEEEAVRLRSQTVTSKPGRGQLLLRSAVLPVMSLSPGALETRTPIRYQLSTNRSTPPRNRWCGDNLLWQYYLHPDCPSPVRAGVKLLRHQRLLLPGRKDCPSCRVEDTAVWCPRNSRGHRGVPGGAWDVPSSDDRVQAHIHNSDESTTAGSRITHYGGPF
jgi:hypothetical protein